MPDDSPAPIKALWTLHDAALFLALSVRSVERLRNRGEFPPAVRIGRAVRFEPGAVVAWARAAQEKA
jgi:predicted DNA-binding transcriptional regulator AlpA